MAPYNFNRNGSAVAVPLSNHQEKRRFDDQPVQRR